MSIATVLVVEDYATARKALCLIVSSYGATAIGAANGSSAGIVMKIRPRSAKTPTATPELVVTTVYGRPAACAERFAGRTTRSDACSVGTMSDFL